MIQQRGTLTYPQFVQYVTCPDIVEEFVYLNTEHGGALTFSLVPAQQPRLVTGYAEIEGWFGVCISVAFQ